MVWVRSHPWEVDPRREPRLGSGELAFAADICGIRQSAVTELFAAARRDSWRLSRRVREEAMIPPSEMDDEHDGKTRPGESDWLRVVRFFLFAAAPAEYLG